MAKEIERKFLIVSDEWRSQVSHKVEIQDGILATHDGTKVRVRFYNDRATLTVKGPRKGMTRDEYEYPIPSSEAREMIQRYRIGEILRKTRYYVPAEHGFWNIDEYQGFLSGILFAEIELPAENTKLSKPNWLGREITENKEYRQMYMRHGHPKNWNTEESI